jgi:Sensors of blue-light using FAD
MHQIVYTSTASEDFSTADLKKLLLGARRRNKALGVSGMLVFHDGTFLQALEGEQRAINEIFASIVSDRRHRDIDCPASRTGLRPTRIRGLVDGLRRFHRRRRYSQRLRSSQRTTAHQGTRRLAGDGTARHLRSRRRDQERRRLEHDPEKACPGLDPGWMPVFRKACPRARPEGSCSTKDLERDDDST